MICVSAFRLSPAAGQPPSSVRWKAARSPHRERDRLYRAFFSGRADALAEMSAEYRVALWGMRVAGSVLDWASFLLLFSPVSRLLGGVPLLGGLGKGPIAIVTFVAAALVALVIGTFAYLFHDPLILLVCLP